MWGITFASLSPTALIADAVLHPRVYLAASGGGPWTLLPQRTPGVAKSSGDCYRFSRCRDRGVSVSKQRRKCMGRRRGVRGMRGVFLGGDRLVTRDLADGTAGEHDVFSRAGVGGHRTRRDACLRCPSECAAIRGSSCDGAARYGGQHLRLRRLEHTTAATVSQYHYTQLISGAIVAYLLFQERTTSWMWRGGADCRFGFCISR